MNRTIIITGASGSMGSEAVKALAAGGDNIIMACRNLAKAENVRERILREIGEASIEILPLDLSSLSSVRTFCDALKGREIDAMLNNAGVINRDFRITGDGFESTLQTNYIGVYLLTRLLLPQMSEGANIVNMVSLTCRFGKVDEGIFEANPEKFSQLGTYSNTKLSLLLFSIVLAEKAEGVRVNVADPGVVNSNMISMGRWFDPLADIFFRPLCRRPEVGVAPALRALYADCSLNYFVGKRNAPIAERYMHHPMLSRLWEDTQRLLNL